MEILYLNIKALKLFFLWPTKGSRLFQRIIPSILFISLVTSCYIDIAAASIHQIMVNFEDDGVIFDGIISTANYMGYILIYISSQKNARNVQRLTGDIEKFLKYCSVDVIDDAEKEIQMFTKGLISYFFGGLILNNLIPLLDSKNCEKQRLSDLYKAHDPCGLAVRIWWPFDGRKAAQFYSLLFRHVFVSISVAFLIMFITLTLVGLLIHLIAQMKHLKQKLLNIFSDDIDESIETDINDVEAELQLCVQYHNDIIRQAYEIFRCFGVLLIVYVTFTPFVFGVLGYHIVSLDRLTDKLRFTLHLGGWIAILFLTCHYGQLILDESLSVSEAAYQSKWYNGHPRLRKYISLIIMRSQRPLEMKAASITGLTLDTFVSIMKTAYSCFTLLLTVAE